MAAREQDGEPRQEGGQDRYHGQQPAVSEAGANGGGRLTPETRED